MTGDEAHAKNRELLLGEIDVQDAAIHYANENALTTEDLWWLYDTHQIMAPADAWLLAAMWEDNIPEDLVERTLGSPQWWSWFDAGIAEARRRTS